MNNESVKQLKENKEIKFIYKIPCSLYTEGYEFIIVGDNISIIDTNVRLFTTQEWFDLQNQGSLLNYVCSTLPRKYKLKEYLNVYNKPNMLQVRKYLMQQTSEFIIKQESLWGLQIINEFKVNRPDVFTSKISSKDALKEFLLKTDGMYKQQLWNKNY